MAFTTDGAILSVTNEAPIARISFIGGEDINFADFDGTLSSVSDNIALPGGLGAFDPDYAFAWRVVSGSATLTNDDAETVTINAPNVGPVRLGLIVNSEAEVFADVDVAVEVIPVEAVNLRQVPSAIDLSGPWFGEKILARKIKVGKTLNVEVDVTNNIQGDLTAFSARTAAGLAAVGTVTHSGGKLIVPVTGAVVGADRVIVEYASALESDCQNFIINIESC